MYKQVSRLLAGLLLGTVPLWAAAGIGSLPANPGFGEPTYSQAEYREAYGQGRTTGRQEAAAECLGDPSKCGCVDGISPCGISLSSVLSGARFGETEPNDHIVASDGLIPTVQFWGQSRNAIDQDWFYLTTVEPNQILTINFTVPYNPTGNGGWYVAVRDAGGNLYAEFDTSFMPDDPTTATNESLEINYPVFLGHTGTYYVVVRPSIEAGPELSFPYLIAVVLEYSGLDNVPPDVNFHDVEIEPNNDRPTANSLASGVTMYGLLRQTTDTVAHDPNNPPGDGLFLPTPGDPTGGGQIYVQSDRDFFKYLSTGNEQISFAWCGREACTRDGFWFVEITDPTGTPLVSFNTDKAETVHFGLADPGEYFVEVNFQRNTDAYCSEFSDTEFECKQETTECMVLEVTPNEGGDGIAPYLECEYVAGDTCGAEAESAETTNCVLAESGDSLPVFQCAGSPTGCLGDGSDPADPGFSACTGTCACTAGVATCTSGTGNCPDAIEFQTCEDIGGTCSCAGDTATCSIAGGLCPDQYALTGGPGDYPRWGWRTSCEERGPVCLTYAPTTDITSLSVEYNFTWWGTKLLPATFDSDAYNDSLERPAWYQDR